MGVFKQPTEQEIQRTNQLQRSFFGELIDVFDPPLPEGVPERLREIVASGSIVQGDVVLDVGTGTGILISLIQEYRPASILACDLSETMLMRLKEHYPYVHAIAGDIRELPLLDESLDVVFMNACYPNIVDKDGSFRNIARMMKPGGRLAISHPMGKSFVDSLKARSPFPLDDFPEGPNAEALLKPYGFQVQRLVDKPKLYILLAVRRNER